MRLKRRLKQYRGLSSQDEEYLAKFDKVFSGRACKKVFDSLNVDEKTRKELYRDRYRARQDEAYKPKAVRFALNEGTMGFDPSDAIIEAIDKKRELIRAQNSPLGGKGPTPRPLSVMPRVAKP